MAATYAAEEATAVLRLPPGLEPPPGLELPCKPQEMLPPPGLDKPKRTSKPKKMKSPAAAPMYIASSHCMPDVASSICPPAFGVTVKISSLPNHLLNKAMMTVTLEQAQLDTFASSIETKPGAQRGEALITFTNADAAVQCARHFNGRRWDASGILVSARLLPVECPLPPHLAFAPLAPQPSSTLSAEAPVFIPGALQSFASSAKETSQQIGSDVSTADGDSNDSSDEKEVTAT